LRYGPNFRVTALGQRGRYLEAGLEPVPLRAHQAAGPLDVPVDGRLALQLLEPRLGHRAPLDHRPSGMNATSTGIPAWSWAMVLNLPSPLVLKGMSPSP
jgi:hypothetical protein